MYFVMIDLRQLHTRLYNCGQDRPVDVFRWLAEHDFVRADDGWLASADGMNCLSCSEMIYSERRLIDLPHRGRLLGLVGRRVAAAPDSRAAHTDGNPQNRFAAAMR